MRTILDSTRRTIFLPFSKSRLSNSGPFSAFWDIRGEPSALISIAMHAQRGRFSAMISLARLLVALMPLCSSIQVLIAVVGLRFPRNFYCGCQGRVVAPVFFVADACCNALSDRAMIFPLTFCVCKLSVDVFIYIIVFVSQLYTILAGIPILVTFFLSLIVFW